MRALRLISTVPVKVASHTQTTRERPAGEEHNIFMKDGLLTLPHMDRFLQTFTPPLPYLFLKYAPTGIGAPGGQVFSLNQAKLNWQILPGCFWKNGRTEVRTKSEMLTHNGTRPLPPSPASCDQAVNKTIPLGFPEV